MLLIPGWGDGVEMLEALVQRLAAAGWPTERAVPPSFQDPVGSDVAHATLIGRAVGRLRDATRAPQVDVVAHAMGGLATLRYLLDGGYREVRRVAFLATPRDGTLSAFLAWGEGAREREPGSAFLLGLKRGRPVPGAVRAITIWTPLDLHVLPPENASLPGLPDLTPCCPSHAGLLDHEETFVLIERFLGDGS